MNRLSSSEVTDFDVVKLDSDKIVDLSNSIKLKANEELSRITNTDVLQLELYDNWIYLNGKVCYMKQIYNLQVLFSELLGETISKYMNLPTIEYKIGKNEDGMYLVSENFKKEELEYIDSVFFGKKKLNSIKNSLLNGEDTPFVKELSKYLITNFYIALTDRTYNTSIIKDNGGFMLAPTYDYESAFVDEKSDIYLDPIISYNFYPASSEKMLDNKYFEEGLYKLLDMEFENIINKVEEEKGIVFPNRLAEYYLDFNNERKEYIKTLGLHK